MIVRTPTVTRSAFETATGWQFKPEGACKGSVCIPLRNPPGESFDATEMARTLGLPVAEDPEHGVAAIGPESVGNRALTSIQAPDLNLPDLQGNPFSLSSLRGQKVLVYAWAPY